MFVVSDIETLCKPPLTVTHHLFNTVDYFASEIENTIG
jgi:hypothetical protein